MLATRRLASALLLLLGSATRASALDLEVIVHEGTPTGRGVAHLDLLLCAGGPCVAVETTDRKGRALFPAVAAGVEQVRASGGPCGPIAWPITLDPKLDKQRVDLVAPVMGRLRVQVAQGRPDGSTAPLAETPVTFLVRGSAEVPGFPSNLSAGSATDAKGMAELCLPAETDFDVTVEVAGLTKSLLPRQRLRPDQVANAQVVLRKP